MSTSAPVRLTTSVCITLGLLTSAASTLAQRHFLAAAQAFIGRNDDVGITIVEPVGQRVGRKPAKDHGMNRTDPCAGQHGIGSFGDHRHVDRDAVALLGTHHLQRIGHAADFVKDFAIGDVLGVFAGVVGFPDDRCLVGAA